MKQYILAVDQGSQSTKLIIFDKEGRVICEARDALSPMHLADGGVVEHPGDDLWDSLVRASNKLMERFDGDPNDIAAVGLCTIRFCRALIKKDGSLFSPVMNWMDDRVSRIHEQISDDIGFVTASSGYITERLTGVFSDTAANYQGVWPMNTDTWDWLADEDGFEEYNLRRDQLPKLVMPGDILGYITEEVAKETGIPAGLPVVATANDKAVEALGAGCSDEDTAVISLGTYIAGMVLGSENRKNTVNYWTNFADIPNKYLYESNGIRRGMWTISWFRDVLGESYAKMAEDKGMSAEELMSIEAAKVPAGSDGLMTVPEFLAPTSAPYKKGMMIGFDGRHTRAHMYRSILEAIAMTMKNRMDEMSEELGKSPKRLIITGGGSNSPLFMQIFADVFNLPTYRNEINGAAAVGAAMNAAVAVGMYDSYDEAVKGMVRIHDEYIPNERNYQTYSRMNQVYKSITDYTDPLLKKAWEEKI